MNTAWDSPGSPGIASQGLQPCLGALLHQSQGTGYLQAGCLWVLMVTLSLTGHQS